MKGLGFIDEKPNSGSKTGKFDVPKVVCHVVLYKIKAKKILPSVIGIDHFLDTRTIKIEARNVVVTSLQWQKKRPLLTCCDV